MQNIENLSSEERKLLCDIIGGKELKKYFQKYNYLRISGKLKTHRQRDGIAELSDREAVNLAKSNVKDTYISFFLYKILSRWYEQVDQNYWTMINNGVNEEFAVVTALSKSILKNVPHIFFKISDRQYKEETKKTCLFIFDSMNSAKNTSNIASQLRKVREVWQHDKKILLNKVREQERSIQQLKKEKEQLKARENQLSCDLEKQREEIKLYQEGDTYEDEAEHESSPEFPYTSLCEVIGPSHKNKNVIKLKRLADIDKKGTILDLYAENTPERDILYYHSYHSAGGFSEGMIGIWNWNQEPNREEGRADFVRSCVNKIYSPVEIIVLPECNSERELIQSLHEGIVYKVLENINRVLFAYPKGFSQYSGILCVRKQLDEMNDRCILQNKFYKLPIYNFDDTEILSTEGHMFFRRLYLGNPKRLLSVGNAMDAVKEILLERVSWRRTKKKGFTKAEYKKVHAFIEELQTEDFTQSVMERCDCSDSAEADALIQQFKKNAEKYINQTDLESEIVEDVVRRNEDLLGGCYQSIEEEWKTSHAVEMNELKNELNKVRNTIADEKQNLDGMRQKHEVLKRDNDSITADIKRQKLLADTVEQQVKQRIKNIQENASSFLTDMMFQLPLYQSSNSHILEKSRKNYFEKGTFVETLKGEFVSNDGTCIELLKENLMEAGVIKQISGSLATYLYGAHLLRIPLILTGPGSEDIADAMAITFTERRADKLTFTGDVDEASITRCLEDDGKFITIANPFNTNWAYKLPELLRTPSKYFVLATPYPEELLIEPGSLYNLALPVLTDILVDKEASGKYISVKKAASYKDQRRPDELGNYGRPPLLGSLEISSLARTFIQRLYNCFCQLWKESPDEFFFIYGLLPLAYSLGKIDIARAHIQANGPRLSKINHELVRPYLGD